jgi:hypothetical protein
LPATGVATFNQSREPRTAALSAALSLVALPRLEHESPSEKSSQELQP